MSSTPATNDDLTFALATAAGAWLTAIERALPDEKDAILRRGASNPASEISIRVEFKSKVVILEVSDGTTTTELVRVDIDSLQPADDIQDSGEGTDLY